MTFSRGFFRVGWLFGVLALPCLGTTIDFSTLGTFSTPSLSVGGVTVTGSANVHVGPSGLGIVGGPFVFSDQNVDEGEFITFTFSSLVTGVVFDNYACAGVTLPLCGQSTLAGFGAGGVPLGTVQVVFFPPPAPDFSGLFGNQPLSSFRLTVNNDGNAQFTTTLTPRSITFTTVAPEPSSLLLLLTGVGLVAARVARRR